jgi:hypothetical protein
MRPTRRVALGLGAIAAALVAAPSRLPRQLVVIGDSWAAGLHADPQHALGQVAAADLGWGVTVDAVSGTGYVNGDDDERSYVDRIADLRPRRADIVVLQGGSNDRSEPSELFDLAVKTTLSLARDHFRGARRVLLGPGPDPLPVTDDQREVDRRLAALARTAGVDYISILQEGWISATSHVTALDPDNHHPTVAGQLYLGRRLAAALRHHYPQLTETPVI